MAKDCCVLKLFVYFIVACDIVGGILYIFNGSHGPNLRGHSLLTILEGVLAVLLGALLLVGALKENEKFVLVYFIASTEFLFIFTVLTVVFSGAIGFEPEIIVYLVILLVLWAVQYCIYVFYKHLSDKNKSSANGGNAQSAFGGDAKTTIQC